MGVKDFTAAGEEEEEGGGVVICYIFFLYSIIDCNRGANSIK